MELEKKLKNLNLKRDSQHNLGKRIGNNLWIYKDYIDIFFDNNEIKYIKSHIPKDFKFDIIRFNNNKTEISFIESPDFLTAQEPIVGKSLKFFLENGKILNKKIHNNSKDPLIYHHKWMFVKDDFNKFDVKESKKRSIAWKNVLGKNKEVSIRIGRFSYWNNWIAQNESKIMNNEENNIKKFIEKKQEENISKDIWSIYIENSIEQSITSAATARLQIPQSLKIIKDNEIFKNSKKILDIGCGSKNQKFKEELENINFEYHGIDPFNKDRKNNIDSILKCMNGNTDIVTLNNVLNTIPEKSVWKGILIQAKNALNDQNGIAVILTYEGEKNREEKEYEKVNGTKIEKLTPIKTRDGWQNRMKTEEYLDAIKEVFPNVEINRYKGAKVIFASKNPDLDLKLKKPSNKNKIR